MQYARELIAQMIADERILCRIYRKGNLIEIIRLFIENGCDVTKETRSNVMISNRNVEEFQKVIQLLEQHAR
jgi:hypothetical protein